MDNDTIKTAGMTFKSASVGSQEVTEEELKEINKFTLSPLAVEDVFAFKLIMCDNEVDRDFESFSFNALSQLQKLFIGKTILKDHNHKADNQVARIYATELVVSEVNDTSNGEPYACLVARCYMVKTAENESLIAEIKGGIKKEVSVGCSIKSAICSICGTDNREAYCLHYPGRTYAKDGNETVCTFTLDNAVDAYECSFVAVPAQRNAGACKNYTGETVYEKDTETKTPDTPENNTDKGSEIDFEIKSLESFIFVENNKEEN